MEHINLPFWGLIILISTTIFFAVYSYIFNKKALYEQINTYKVVIQSLKEAVIVTKNNKIKFINNSGIKLFLAKGQEEFLEKDIGSFFKISGNVDVRKKSKEVNNINEQIFLEYKIVTMENNLVDVETKSICSKIKGKDYKIIVVSDISDRKKVQEKQNLLQEKEEEDKIKIEFFANLSHELRTPINVIYSAIQVMDIYLKNDNNKEGKIKPYCKTIKQNCYRLLRISNNLIDSTRIDSGFFKPDYKECNIVSLVEQITLSICSFAESKGINVIFDTEIEEKYVVCDTDMIERILLNLFSNSIKFRRNHGIIKVNLYDNDNNVTICVEDNGIGIPKDKQKEVFSRFKQVDKSFTRNTEGSGIGLSLVKSLVELNGGTISLHSKKGIGSKFIINLPINKALEECCTTCELEHNNIIEKVNIEFSDIYL